MHVSLDKGPLKVSLDLTRMSCDQFLVIVSCNQFSLSSFNFPLAASTVVFRVLQ